MEMNRERALAKKQMFYFTGFACRNGHISKRYVSNGHCVECGFEDAVKFKHKLENDPERHEERNRRQRRYSRRVKHE